MIKCFLLYIFFVITFCFQSEIFCASSPCGVTSEAECLHRISELAKPNVALPGSDGFNLGGSEFKRIADLFSTTYEKSVFWPSQFWFGERQKNCNGYDEYYYIQKSDIGAETRVCVVGDTHGDLAALLGILADMRDRKNPILDQNFKVINPGKTLIVFLGDYTSKGKYPRWVLYTLELLKLVNWKNVFLMRGNHESKNMPSFSGGQFGLPTVGLDLSFSRYFPCCLYLKSGNTVLQLSHGGVMQQIVPEGGALFDYLANFICDGKGVAFSDFGGLDNLNLPNYLFQLLWGDLLIFPHTESWHTHADKYKAYMDLFNSKLSLKGSCLKGCCVGHTHPEEGIVVGNSECDDDFYVVKNGPVQMRDFQKDPVFILNAAGVCKLSDGMKFSYCIMQAAENWDDWIFTPVYGY
jgi:predicted phosphodiesterase